jgi:hypothetical protein
MLRDEPSFREASNGSARNGLVGYGKSTYCGFSTDEGTSICMRISAGARGPSRNGGNIHVHTEIPIFTFPTWMSISSAFPIV